MGTDNARTLRRGGLFSRDAVRQRVRRAPRRRGASEIGDKRGDVVARVSRATLTARPDGREPTDRCMNEAAVISKSRRLSARNSKSNSDGGGGGTNDIVAPCDFSRSTSSKSRVRIRRTRGALSKIRKKYIAHPRCGIRRRSAKTTRVFRSPRTM